MLQLNKYEIYIFDCDGVILDSNQLKIEAMKNALEAHFSDIKLISECIDYFRNNFGKSRFHHVSYFLDSILNIEEDQKGEIEQLILKDFSKQCRSLYLIADLTPGFLAFLEQCKGKKYVASGSQQSELRDVFAQRGLDVYFDGIFGSPTQKIEIIRHILDKEKSSNAVVFGDAAADLEAAINNGCFFVAYLPFSYIRQYLKMKAIELDFYCVDQWSDFGC